MGPQTKWQTYSDGHMHELGVWVHREADTWDIGVSRVGTAPELELLGKKLRFFVNKLGFLLIYLPESL